MGSPSFEREVLRYKVVTIYHLDGLGGSLDITRSWQLNNRLDVQRNPRKNCLLVILVSMHGSHFSSPASTYTYVFYSLTLGADTGVVPGTHPSMK